MKLKPQWYPQGEFVQVALAQFLHSLKSQMPSGLLGWIHNLRQNFVPQAVAQMTNELSDLRSVFPASHSTKTGTRP